jgi:hypothetical protein
VKLVNYISKTYLKLGISINAVSWGYILTNFALGIVKSKLTDTHIKGSKYKF